MDAWVEFEALRPARGGEYENRRNDLLRTTPDLQRRLAAYHNGSDWYHRTQARILEGWLQHAALYKKVLSELGEVDEKKEGRTAGGIPSIWGVYEVAARKRFREAILPLCWEVFLKFNEVWPTWKIVTFLYMTGAVPNANSVEPVLFLMEQSSDLALIDLSGRVLELLPAAAGKAALSNRPQLIKLSDKQEPAPSPKGRRLRDVLLRVLAKWK